MVANNDDLLTEILVRLPINSVLAFKSLSKHWLSLISNPHFCRRSTALSNPSCGLFLLRPSISTNPNPSCNGLLLCSTSGGPEARKKYYVYNPTTKHYTILPQLPKVVCVKSRNSEQTQLEFEIYSSEMGAWPLSTSKSFLSPISTYNIDFNGGVFWNGAIHWISTREAAGALYFNLEEERFSEMPLPPLPEDWKDWNESQFGYFGESGDHLHVIGMYNPPSKCFNVYEMKRDYSGWFAKFRVDLWQSYLRKKEDGQ
nr:F-box protein At5g07610-like [Ziziphus jujuba var. spinosa]